MARRNDPPTVAFATKALTEACRRIKEVRRAALDAYARLHDARAAMVKLWIADAGLAATRKELRPVLRSIDEQILKVATVVSSVRVDVREVQTRVADVAEEWGCSRRDSVRLQRAALALHCGDRAEARRVLALAYDELDDDDEARGHAARAATRRGRNLDAEVELLTRPAARHAGLAAHREMLVELRSRR